MTLIEHVIAKYDKAIEDLRTQIQLPANVAARTPQIVYNRNKQFQQTGRMPGKHVHQMEIMIEELVIEKRYILKGIALTMQCLANVKEVGDNWYEFL